MFRLVFYNVIVLLVLSPLLIFASHALVMAPLKKKAYQSYAKSKRNPYFNEFTETIGRLADNETPTSYVKIKPDQSKLRIGFFGDSHTAGSETERGEDFPSILQKLLGNEKYQVINFGHEGFNSNQIFLMAQHFSKVFGLDMVFFGPRGFHVNQATTFNNYWNQGQVPYSRFILKDDKLIELKVKGEKIKQRISNYYSLFPSSMLLKHDHVAPSILKFFDTIISRELLNPFYKSLRSQRSVRAVQIAQLEVFSNSFKGPIFHYTDSDGDCESFKNVTAANYNLYCINAFLDDFPNRARNSRPSSFGYRAHAKNIESLLKMKKLNSWRPVFRDDETQFKISKKNLFLEAKSNQKIVVTSNETLLGTIEPISWQIDTTGRMHNPNLNAKDSQIILGLYYDDSRRSDSLFIRIPINKENAKVLEKLKLETHVKISNLAFLKIPANRISHPGNTIYFNNKWESDFPVDQFFNNLGKRKGLFAYQPKVASFKLTVNEKIKASEFLNSHPKKEFLLTWKAL